MSLIFAILKLDFKYPFHTNKVSIIWQRINVDYFPASHCLIEQLIFFTGSLEPKTKIRSAFGVYRMSIIFRGCEVRCIEGRAIICDVCNERSRLNMYY